MYDVAIIGTGCAGLSAAIYSSRYNLKTIVFGEMPGGLITTTHLVENYPGLGSISGPELGEKFLEHVNMLENAETKYTKVKNIKKEGDIFILETAKEEYKARTIIIATGSEHRKLNAKGEEKLANRGVSYCATCDGAFFRDKVTCVIGGSDSAAKEALMLSDICKKVYIIYRGKEIRPEPINKTRVENNSKIEVLNEREVGEFVGEKKLEKIIFKENKGELEVDGAFIEIGYIPQTETVKNLGVNLNEKGQIIIDKNGGTNISGIYCAGDVSSGDFNQAIISAAEGCYAARAAFNYIGEL